MKKLALLAALALLAPVCLASGAAPRDEAIKHIENLQMRHAIITPDSPFVTQMLQPALKDNPDVPPQAWNDIRREVSVAIAETMTQPGGVLDTFYRTALAPLSDAELVRLETLLNDPVLVKFNASMTSSATQQQLLKALMVNGKQMEAALNTVLVSHGLKTVH